MQSLQERTLRLIAATIEDAGLDPVQVAIYGNCGEILAQRPGTLASAASVEYDFQGSRVTLSLSGDSRQATGLRYTFDTLDAGERFPKLLNALSGLLGDASCTK